MTVPISNLSVNQGADFTITVKYQDSDGNNLLATATSSEAQIRQSPPSTTILATFTTEFNMAHDGIILTLTPDQTQALPGVAMVWDLKVTWPDLVDFIAGGSVFLTQTVTRA